MENKTPGFELLEKKLVELEQLSQRVLPSLNAFLEENHLFMTKQDMKSLRKLMVANKKWKLISVYDWRIERRGKKK